ncbi:MAG TPA: hypothetical protein VLJ76_05230 [Gaiellaceae bacterium]|nr:hypothetical protein [Gaiellaceae bacterium]
MRATLLVVAAAAALAATAAAAPTRAACTPGPFSKGGASGVAFCGPAKAMARVGAKLFSFTSGSCTQTSKYLNLNLNLGAEVLSGPKGSFSYFGLLVGAYPGASRGTKASPKDGTYSGGLVTLRWLGKDDILNGAGDKNVKITRKNGRTAGTFSGTTFLAPHLRVIGTFIC